MENQKSFSTGSPPPRPKGQAFDPYEGADQTLPNEYSGQTPFTGDKSLESDRQKPATMEEEKTQKEQSVKMPDPDEAKQYFETKLKFTAGPMEVDRLRREKGKYIQLVDVRAAEDYQKEHLPGAINLPQDGWGNLTSLARDKTNILYCYSIVCYLATRACARFAGEGYAVMEMEGGFKEWKKHHLETEGG